MKYTNMSDQALREHRAQISSYAEEARNEGRVEEAMGFDHEVFEIDAEFGRRANDEINAHIDAEIERTQAQSDLAREEMNRESERWRRDHP